jgi:hypothetical protein
MVPTVRPSAMCRAVPGHHGYHVTRGGVLFTTRRVRPGSKIKQSTDRGGYKKVTLHNGPSQINKYVHVILLDAWVGPCPDGMQCRHLDGNPANNQIANLVWGTPRENEADKRAHGTTARGRRNGYAKLDEARVREIICLCNMGARNSDVASVFNIDPATVSLIMTGKTWTHIDCPRNRPVCHRRGNECYGSRLTPDDVREIRQLHDNGVSRPSLARQFSVSWQSIDAVVKGRSWKHIK